MTIPEIRAAIAEARQQISDMQQAELRRDGRDHGHDRSQIDAAMARANALRAELIAAATWSDLETDQERDQYLLRFFERRAMGPSAVDGLAYLSNRLRLARETEELRKHGDKVRRERESWKTKARGYEAKLILEGRRAELASDGDDKLTVLDFLRLIEKSNTNDQLQEIVGLLDLCFRDGSAAMQDEDWPIITAAVSRKKQ